MKSKKRCRRFLKRGGGGTPTKRAHPPPLYPITPEINPAQSPPPPPPIFRPDKTYDLKKKAFVEMSVADQHVFHKTAPTEKTKGMNSLKASLKRIDDALDESKNRMMKQVDVSHDIIQKLYNDEIFDKYNNEMYDRALESLKSSSGNNTDNTTINFIKNWQSNFKQEKGEVLEKLQSSMDKLGTFFEQVEIDKNMEKENHRLLAKLAEDIQENIKVAHRFKNISDNISDNIKDISENIESRKQGIDELLKSKPPVELHSLLKQVELYPILSKIDFLHDEEVFLEKQAMEIITLDQNNIVSSEVKKKLHSAIFPKIHDVKKKAALITFELQKKIDVLELDKSRFDMRTGHHMKNMIESFSKEKQEEKEEILRQADQGAAEKIKNILQISDKNKVNMQENFDRGVDFYEHELNRVTKEAEEAEKRREESEKRHNEIKRHCADLTKRIENEKIGKQIRHDNHLQLIKLGQMTRLKQENLRKKKGFEIFLNREGKFTWNALFDSYRFTDKKNRVLALRAELIKKKAIAALEKEKVEESEEKESWKKFSKSFDSFEQKFKGLLPSVKGFANEFDDVISRLKPKNPSPIKQQTRKLKTTSTPPSPTPEFYTPINQTTSSSTTPTTLGFHTPKTGLKISSPSPISTPQFHTPNNNIVDPPQVVDHQDSSSELYTHHHQPTNPSAKVKKNRTRRRREEDTLKLQNYEPTNAKRIGKIPTRLK